METIKKVEVTSPEFEVLYKECFKDNTQLKNAHRKIEGMTVYVEHGITYAEFKIIESRRKTPIVDRISKLA